MKNFIFFFVFLCFSSTVALSSPKQRILALSPHACEMLYAIGAETQLVGAVSYCDYPTQALLLPRVGGYQRINVEAALRLKPNIAVVLSRQVTGVTKLEQMGVQIVISNPTNFSMIFDDLLKLGKLTRHVKQAETLVSQLRQRLKRVRQTVPNNIAVFYEIWPDPMMTAGGTGFISSLIHEAGGKNVFADIQMDTPRVNIESVLRANPELIVIPQEKRDVIAREKFWRKWLKKENLRFAVINPDLLHRPGPRLLDGLELLHQAFQAEKTKAGTQQQ